MFASTAILALLPLLAVAQYDAGPGVSSSAAPAMTSMTGAAGSPATYKVTVGNGALAYAPNMVMANIGDQIEFAFYAVNHSMTQSSFMTPCSHLVAADGMTPVGIDSGYVPVAAGVAAGMNPTFTITVTSTDPLYFYCRQGLHCENGMVFAINPPATGNSIAAFIASAKALTIPATTLNQMNRLNGTGVYANKPVVLAGMAPMNGTSVAAGATSAASAASTAAMTAAETAAASGSAAAPSATKAAGASTSMKVSFFGAGLAGALALVLVLSV